MQSMKNKTKALYPEELSTDPLQEACKTAWASVHYTERSNPSQRSICAIVLPFKVVASKQLTIAMETKYWNSIRGDSV